MAKKTTVGNVKSTKTPKPKAPVGQPKPKGAKKGTSK